MGGLPPVFVIAQFGVNSSEFGDIDRNSDLKALNSELIECVRCLCLHWSKVGFFMVQKN